MFADILEAIELATEEGGDVVRAFQLARAKGIAKFIKFSGISQADAASVIGVSSTGIQKMISEPASLTKHLDALTDMLCLPKGSISSPQALSSFAKTNVLYVNTLDAVTTYTAAKNLPTGVMPTDYVINQVKSYLSDNYKAQCARLVAYFSAPNKNSLQGEDITALEESVEVPAGSIQNPAEFMATRTKVTKLSFAVRKKISANIARILSERKLSESDIAIKAGVALVSISNLLEKPYRCTLALLVALASALEVEPHQLMQGQTLRSEVQEPLQPSLFEDLPRASREFILAYITAAGDKREGLPTAKANAVLLATPFLKHGVDVLTEYSSQGSDEDNPRNIGELVNQIAATLRTGL